MDKTAKSILLFVIIGIAIFFGLFFFVIGAWPITVIEAIIAIILYNKKAKSKE